ncbi:MAG: T9SS type A sorting domain-containing protein [Bacteroidia bacterium]
MKKLLLSSATLLSLNFAFAQTGTVPNGGFENWGSTFAQPQEPVSWISGNVLCSPLIGGSGNPTSVFKETGAGNFNGGTASVKVTTVRLTTNQLASSGLNDTVGFCFTGGVQTVPSVALVRGVAYTGRPAMFDFWHKYTPSGVDHGAVAAFLTKWNTGTNQRDTVAVAFYPITGTVSTLTHITIPLTYSAAYNAGGNPDTALVAVASSWGSQAATYPVRPKIGSILWADDVDLTGTYVGIKENTKASEIRVFPNPAVSSINITTNSEDADRIELYDVTGKKVFSGGIEDKKIKIYTDNLADGLYIYTVSDKSKKVLASGKVNVSK